VGNGKNLGIFLGISKTTFIFIHGRAEAVGFRSDSGSVPNNTGGVS
jgi:hypothetical protein